MKFIEKWTKPFTPAPKPGHLAMVIATSLAMFQSGAAFAQTTGASGIAQPVITILQEVQQAMEGPLGVSVFIIGLGALGMACLRGMVPWGWVVAWVVGAVFLFGAPQMVSTIQSALGSGS